MLKILNTVEDENHEAGEVDYAPQAVYLKSRYANITGGYVIIPKTCCERPVYFSEQRGMFVLYGGKNWIVGPSDRVTGGGYAYMAESEHTDATFPTLARWLDGVIVEEVSSLIVSVGHVIIRRGGGHSWNMLFLNCWTKLLLGLVLLSLS